MPADELPLPVQSNPGKSKAHKPLPEAGVTRLATECRKASNVTGITNHAKVDFSRFPLERFPQPFSARVKVEVVSKVFFTHAPRKILVEDIAFIVERFPERLEITAIEGCRPCLEYGFQILC